MTTPWTELKENMLPYIDNWDISHLQIVIYVATGGGMIGRLFAEQPADAYIDIRVGKRPYPFRQIEKIRKTLIALAELKGYDPHNLPKMPSFHNCGIF